MTSSDIPGLRSIVGGALLAVSAPCLAIDFDGAKYVEGFRQADADSTIIEYVPPGSTVEKWATLLTIQCHPDATALKDVVGPYFEARRSMIATAPEAIPNESAYAEDANLLLFLGSPQMGRVEFSIARWVRKDKGVIGLIYSYNLPVQQNVDVTVVMTNRDRWIKNLAAVPFEALQAECEAKTRP